MTSNSILFRQNCHLITDLIDLSLLGIRQVIRVAFQFQLVGREQYESFYRHTIWHEKYAILLCIENKIEQFAKKTKICYSILHHRYFSVKLINLLPQLYTNKKSFLHQSKEISQILTKIYNLSNEEYEVLISNNNCPQKKIILKKLTTDFILDKNFGNFSHVWRHVSIAKYKIYQQKKQNEDQYDQFNRKITACLEQESLEDKRKKKYKFNHDCDTYFIKRLVQFNFDDYNTQKCEEFNPKDQIETTFKKRKYQKKLYRKLLQSEQNAK